jgi:hypothetical protein
MISQWALGNFLGQNMPRICSNYIGFSHNNPVEKIIRLFPKIPYRICPGGVYRVGEIERNLGEEMREGVELPDPSYASTLPLACQGEVDNPGGSRGDTVRNSNPCVDC